MKMKRVGTILIILCTMLPLSFASAGTILSAHKYAWSNNIGYINFENVVVTDSALSGYAWSANAGWIKFDPTKGGVSNDGSGKLSGFAWGEGLGWIDFSGVSISSTTGLFSGQATGDVVGIINFDCPNYCDVVTDWRVVSVTPHVTTGSSGGTSSSGSRLFASPIGSLHVESRGEPLMMTGEQSGKLVKDVGTGQVVLDIPARSVLGRVVYIISPQALTQTNRFLVLSGTELINGFFYDVYAIDGDSHYVHNFDKPLTITLPLSGDETGNVGLGVYWLNETNWQWVLIPDAVFFADHVTFSVSHLTKFAIFSMDDVPGSTLKTQAGSENLGKNAAPVLTLPTSTRSLYDEGLKNEPENIGVVGSSSVVLVDEIGESTDFNPWNWVVLIVVLCIIFYAVFISRSKKH